MGWVSKIHGRLTYSYVSSIYSLLSSLSWSFPSLPRNVVPSHRHVCALTVSFGKHWPFPHLRLSRSLPLVSISVSLSLKAKASPLLFSLSSFHVPLHLDAHHPYVVATFLPTHFFLSFATIFPKVASPYKDNDGKPSFPSLALTFASFPLLSFLNLEQICWLSLYQKSTSLWVRSLAFFSLSYVDNDYL